MKKIFMYPIVVTAIIILMIGCNVAITAAFAVAFNTTMANVVYTPIMLLYVISGFCSLYLATEVCIEISKKDI